MKKRFLKAAAAMMAISLTVTSVGVMAYAEDNQENLEKNDEDWDVNNGNFGINTGDIVTNNGDIEENHGTIGTNTATIDDNYGSIEHNEGEVIKNANDDEKGFIEDNGEAGTVVTNEGQIKENNGYVNENIGEINDNYDNIYENTSGENSALLESSGKVDRNFGTINTNSSKASEKPDSQTDYSDGGVDKNYGTIWTNNGYVGTNASIRIYIEGDEFHDKGDAVGENDEYDPESQATFYGNINRNNGIVNENHATIGGNGGTINENYGNVYSSSGIIDMNGELKNVLVYDQNTQGHEVVKVPDENAVVRENTGEVLENNGIVDNFVGGTVFINNGKVYNYGGSIENYNPDSKKTEYGTGTEYFSVSINKSEGLSTSYTEGGFTYHNGDNWLGETRNSDGDRNRTTSTVTVTPTDGYEISEFVIPDPYKNYVSAKKEDNGTWTLTVKSGCNISLTPTATYIRNTNNSDIINTGDSNDSQEENKIAITVDISSDNNDDSGNDPAPKSDPANNSAGQVANPNNALPPITLNSVDVANLGISVSVSDVMEKVNNITAMNNFIAAGRTLPSTENIMACGIIDFKNLFTNAETGNVEVPVEATVVAGNTYTVVLSDGTLLAVECTVNGILNIPFATNAQNLTFIIYGTQSNSLAPIG